MSHDSPHEFSNILPALVATGFFLLSDPDLFHNSMNSTDHIESDLFK